MFQNEYDAMNDDDVVVKYVDAMTDDIVNDDDVM